MNEMKNEAETAAVAVPANLPTGDEIRAIARSVSTSSSDSPSSSEYVMAGYRAALAATPAAVAAIDWEAAAEKIAIEVARNCGTVPNLTHPYIYLGLKALFAGTTTEASPVVLPEPDAAIKEVMGLVSDWGMASHCNGEAALDAHAPEATPDEIAYAAECQERERSVWQAIESKLRALLATATGLPAQAQQPDGFVSVEAYDRLQALCDSQAARILAAEDAEPVHWRVVLDPEQVPHQLKTSMHAVGFRDKHSAESWIAERLDFDGWRYTLEPLYAAPQAQADARDAQLLAFAVSEIRRDEMTDSALLDAMEQNRIAVVPEYEGPWDAEIYNDEGKPNHRGSGSTPREAIRAAIAAQAAQGGE